MGGLGLKGGSELNRAVGVLCGEVAAEGWGWPKLLARACRVDKPGAHQSMGGMEGGAQAEIIRGWDNNPASGQKGALPGEECMRDP